MKKAAKGLPHWKYIEFYKSYYSTKRKKSKGYFEVIGGLHFSLQRLVGAAPEFSGAPVFRSNSGHSALNFAAAFPTLRSKYLYSLH
jgi:hypothetical protein